MDTRTRGSVGLLLLAALVGLGFALVNRGVYGVTIFALLPAFVGALTSWVFRPATDGQAIGWSTLAVLAFLFSFLVFGMEGLICIAMAIPLAVPMSILGGWITYRSRSSRLAGRSVAMLLLMPPAGVTWDVVAPPPVFQVRTSIEIAAPPEQVWKYVVAFPKLAEPQEWYFRVGLGYPTQTRIEGSGPGAARYCDFSTGSFIEQVEVWDEPRLLRFRVTESAAPMREWSPYGEIVTKHLHGYFISREGQFQLTRLPNNHTLVEGTSWYEHGLRPAQYWRWWSDAIIHRIHVRVLNHIKGLAESTASATDF